MAEGLVLHERTCTGTELRQSANYCTLHPPQFDMQTGGERKKGSRHSASLDDDHSVKDRIPLFFPTTVQADLHALRKAHDMSFDPTRFF